VRPAERATHVSNVAWTDLAAIVFDVDGTLYRQAPLRRAMLLRLLGHVASRPHRGVATFRALSAYRHAQESLRGAPVEGGLAEAQMRLACESSGMAEAVLAPIVARWMDREPLPYLERCVEPSLRTLLAAARSRGLRLGVFSDYPAAAKLAAMRLSEFFDVAVSAQDTAVNSFKPDPAGLVEALRRLGVRPEQALYVGDRHDVDFPAARAAGVPCVIVGARRTPANGAFTSVAHYGELHAMLF
jgi:putative hydrolase of the HAD superfamily